MPSPPLVEPPVQPVPSKQAPPSRFRFMLIDPRAVVKIVFENPAATKRLIAVLLTVWPLVLGLVGLPTGMAQKAVVTFNEFTGEPPLVTPEQCPVCPVCDNTQEPADPGALDDVSPAEVSP